MIIVELPCWHSGHWALRMWLVQTGMCYKWKTYLILETWDKKRMYNPNFYIILDILHKLPKFICFFFPF